MIGHQPHGDSRARGILPDATEYGQIEYGGLPVVNAIESAWGSGVKRSSRGSAFVAKFENRLPAALHLSQSRGERRCLIVVANSRSRRQPRPRVAQNSIGCTPTKTASLRAFRWVSKLRSSSM